MEGLTQMLMGFGLLVLVGLIGYAINGGPVNETNVGDIGSER